MTDGSVLGDLADEKSPRHSLAARLFQRQYDELPDLDAPPQGRAFNGDLCKMRGHPHIYDGVSWVRLDEAMNRKIDVEYE